VTTAENIFDSIKQVWASLVSPRSVKLRRDVNISLDDCYMGVIIQEEVKAEIGGVMVTTNPTNKNDFRNIYMNVSKHSVENIVQGVVKPYQYLYNTVEGGGRTLSMGTAKSDLDEAYQHILQNLAIAGRLLQSHFSPDYTYNSAVDIEWLATDKCISILQLRPFSR
jgi:phosphoenolpyruvate synthase/pyruvate phosphate dikinase